MKNWMIALALVAVLGFTGFAEAKGNKSGKHGKGVHGKITAVDATSFTLATGGKKNPQTVTVKFDNNTTVTVDGAAGKIDSSDIGKVAKVVGSTDGTTVTASSVTISGKHKHGKKNK